MTKVPEITRITVSELRNDLSNFLYRTLLRGETFIITKNGKPKAMLRPVVHKPKKTRPDSAH
jgi:prevent-host-death family protein